MIGTRDLDLRIMLTLEERKEDTETHYQRGLLGSKMDIISKILISRTIISLIPHLTRITRIPRINITHTISIISSKKEGMATIVSIPRITIAPLKRRTARAAWVCLGNL